MSIGRRAAGPGFARIGVLVAAVPGLARQFGILGQGGRPRRVVRGQGAVGLLYRKELQEAPDRKAAADQLIAQYREEFASPYLSASRGYITDVIDPAETRGVVALSLRKTLRKRELRPAKKHGNVPL